MKTKLLYGLFLPFLMMPFFLNAQLIFEITSPPELAGQYPVGSALFGPTLSDTLTGSIAAGEDGTMNPTLGCEALTTDLSGSIGLLDRGDCEFNVKVENAQNAGATALIVANSANEIVNMPGENPNVTIPSFLIQQSLSTAIRAALENGDVEVNIFRNEIIVWGGPDDPNSTFDGGLNGWTSRRILTYQNDPLNQPDSFVWIPEGDVTAGLVSNEDNIIESPTAANGAAGMNFDFLITGGTTSPGDPPYPFFVSELISPVIDLSDNSKPLALSFYQLIRILNNVGEDFYTAVSFSSDGGENWGSPQVLNSDLVSQDRAQNQIVIPMPQNFVDAEEFRMKFIVSMDFYYWVIDDVALRELPETNVAITETFNPLSAFATPAAHIGKDTFGFRVNFINEGFNVDSLLCEVQVLNADNDEILHEQRQFVFNVAPGRDTVIFDDNFPPEIETPGNYLVRYRIDPLNSVDLDYTSNFESYAFQVTDDIYSMDDPARVTSTVGGTSPTLPAGADSWLWGNVYYISEVPEPTAMDTFIPRFLGSEHIYVHPDGQFTDEEAVVLLLEFTQPGQTYDFDLVSGPSNADLNTLPTFDHPAFELKALAIVDGAMLSEAGSGNLLQLQATDFIDGTTNEPITEEFIELDDDRLYFIVTQVDNEDVGQVRLAGVDSDLDAATSLLYWPNAAGEMRNWTGFINSVPVARMNTDVVLKTSAPSTIARDANFEVYPQPTSDKLYMNLDLEEPSDVELEYIDMSGQVVKTSEHKNVGKQTIEENVRTIQTGSYIIKVTSKDGIKTTKVMVIK